MLSRGSCSTGFNLPHGPEGFRPVRFGIVAGGELDGEAWWEGLSLN